MNDDAELGLLLGIVVIVLGSIVVSLLIVGAEWILKIDQDTKRRSSQSPLQGPYCISKDLAKSVEDKPSTK